MESNYQKNKPKETWIQVLRAFACICVLFCHSPAPTDGNTPGMYMLAPFNYLFMAWGVSVFFMISGALLFAKEQKLVPFYKKRLNRILMPIIIWSIIYICVSRIYDTPDKSIMHQIFLIPFYEQEGLLWFMYSLVGIYLISPIISVWISHSERKEIEIVLGIWAVSLFIPYLSVIDQDIKNINYGILRYFWGFVGYALLGYYIRKYVNIPIKSITFWVLVLIAFLMPLIIFFTKVLPVDVLNTSFSISSALMSVVAFLFFKNLDFRNNRLLKIILLFAEFSFGIYLCHMIFLKPFNLWISQFHMHYAIQVPISGIIIGIISFLFVWLLSKIPYSKFLFG